MSKKTKLDKRIDAGLEMMLKHILKEPTVNSSPNLPKPHISTEDKTELIASISGMSRLEISAEMGCTKQRCAQLEACALKKLSISIKL